MGRDPATQKRKEISDGIAAYRSRHRIIHLICFSYLCYLFKRMVVVYMPSQGGERVEQGLPLCLGEMELGSLGQTISPMRIHHSHFSLAIQGPLSSFIVYYLAQDVRMHI